MTPKDSPSSGTSPAKGKLPTVPLRDIAPTDLHAQLNKILASSQFSHSQRMCRFLRFAFEKTLEERQDQLKEYSIGIEVFDRSHDYDPHLDPIVRVEARRLRSKLREYYETEGLHDSLLISLPKGRYALAIEQRATLDAVDIEESAVQKPASPPIKTLRFPKGPLTTQAILLLGLVGLTWFLWRKTSPEHPLRAPPTQLASDYVEMGRPAFSPDGNLIAYASDPDREGFLRIYVKELAGGHVTRITHEEANDVTPSFSPEGTQIVFRRRGQKSRGLFVTSIFGGPERKISDFGSNPRFSPNGGSVVFNIGDADIYHAKLYLTPAEGGEPKQFQENFAAAWLPHWSPDGKHILFAGCQDLKKGDWDFWVAPLDGGAAVRTGIWEVCRKAGLLDPNPSAWAPKVNQILFWAYQGDSTNVWSIVLSPRFVAVGEPVRVTNGGQEECCASAAADGRIAYKTVLRETKLIAVPIAERDGRIASTVPQEIGHGSYHDIALSVSADGERLAFATQHGRRWDLRLKNLKDNTDQTLVPGIDSEVAPDPVIHRDGSQVVYLSRESGPPDIWVVDSKGAPRERICQDCGLPTDWSLDGTKILFTPYHKGQPFPVSLLDRNSRQQSILLRHPKLDLQAARFSPDAQWVSFQAATGAEQRTIYLAPFNPGRIVASDEWIRIGDDQSSNSGACWGSPELLYFRSSRCHETGCVWGQRLESSTRQPVGDPFVVYHNLPVSSGDRMVPALDRVSLALGGSRLFFSVSRTTSSLWMTRMEN